MSFNKFPPPTIGSGDVVGPGSATDDNIATFDGATGKLIQDGGFSISDIVALITALAALSYLTDADETGDLPNSRRLLAGTNITFDDTTPGERTVNASGGGGGSQVYQKGATVDGGGSAITPAIIGYATVPISGTITKVRLLADQAGSAVVDIWLDSFANFPPTNADSITGGNEPTLSAADKYEDSTLTGWTTTVTAGDVLGFNVDSASTITRLTVELEITP